MTKTAEQYLKEHVINEETIKKFGLTWEGTKLYIPVRDEDGKLLFNKIRNLDHDPNDSNSPDKFKNPLGSKNTLFNAQILKTSPYIIICAGEPDCMRLDQENIATVTSTTGEGSFEEEWTPLLINKNTFILMDNDSAGREATKQLLQFIPKARVIELPEGIKDACEFFQKYNKQDFIKLVKQSKNKRQWLRENFPSSYSTISLSEIYQKVFPEEEWIVDKLIPEEGIVGIVGEAGAFKSLFTQYLTKCLIGKQPVLGQFEVKRDCNILFIDKENRLRRTKKRLLAFGVPSTERVRFIESPESFNLENEEFLKFVTDEIEEYRINIIFVDAFIDIFERNENDPVETRKALDRLKQIAPQGTFVVIHHSSKPIPRFRRTALQSTRGSSNIAAQFEAQFYFEKTRDNSIFTIEQGKARDSEPLKKFSVQIVYEPDGPIRDLIYLGETQEDPGLIEEVVEEVINTVTENPGIDRDTLYEHVKEATNCPYKIFEKGLTESRKRKAIFSKRKLGYGNKFYYYPQADLSENTLFDEDK